MTKVLRVLLAFLVVFSSWLVGSPPAAATKLECDDVKIIFARGSGEDLNDTSYQSWRDSIATQLASSSLKYDFYELGSQSYNGAKYPAVAVAGSLNGFGNLLGAYISAGTKYDFGESVSTGRQELLGYIEATNRSCPNTKYVLGGYSQGAMLISGLLSEIDSNKIIYAATFGDPKLYLPEGKGKRPVACQGKNLSNYRAYVSDCHAYEGILGGYQPYQTTGYLDKLGTWCNTNDIMCSSGISLSDHTEYTSRGLYQNAATVIRGKLEQSYPEHFSHSDIATSTSPHDLVILIHTGSYMEPIKRQSYTMAAKSLANRTFSLGGRVALYIYNDSKYLWTRQYCDFSCTAEEFNQVLDAYQFHQIAGWKYNSGLSALKQSMTELEWQVGATKSAVLLSDGAYSRIDRDGTTLDDIVQLSLSIDPVNIYPVVGGEGGRQSVLELAEKTGGQVYTLAEINSAVDEIIGRPTATLKLEEYVGVVGDEFIFDASESEQPGLRYDWDLDADGVFELQSTDAKVHHIYQAPVSGFIQVRLTDSNGYISNMSARVEVTARPAPIPQITDLIANELEIPDTLEFGFRTEYVDRILVAINDAPLGYIDLRQQTTLTVTQLATHDQLRFIPVSDKFGRGDAITYQRPSLEASSPTQPGSSNVHVEGNNQSSNLETMLPVLPKAPNTGIKP